MSLAQRRTAVNTEAAFHRAQLINIADKRRRFDMQRTVRRDKRLDRISKLVYLTLEDYAGPTGGRNGRCCIRQQTIANELSVSLRSVENSIRKLAELGYVVKIRRQCGNRYELSWALNQPPEQQALPLDPDPQSEDGGEFAAPSEDCGLDQEPIVGGESAVLIALSAVSNAVPEVLRPAPCGRCGGTGFLGFTKRLRDGNQTTKSVLCGCKEVDAAGGWGMGEKLLRQGKLTVLGG